jgi:hypothetical protein
MSKNQENRPCGYCGTNIVLTKDHIIPRSKIGNTYGAKNIAYVCRGCNELKDDMTPVEMRIMANEMRSVANRLDRIARRVEQISRERGLPNPNHIGAIA